MTFDLLSFYLPVHFRIQLYNAKPKQLIVRLSTFTVIIFTTGQSRIMGRASHIEAQSTIDSLSYIYKCIVEPLCQVSQTVVFQIDSMYVPINLYKFAKEYNDDVNVHFEPELFPSLYLTHWKPLHVNMFSTGKVIVLGNNAIQSSQCIHEWIEIHLLIL